MRIPNYKKMRDMLGKEYQNLNNDDTMYEFLKSFNINQIPKKKVAITTDGSEVWVPEGSDIVNKQEDKND
jgi:hypothetical protein